jgi:hypothetical protein
MPQRIPVPKNIEAEVLFKADHTCSICRKSVAAQIAHIDGNPQNNNEDNLLVLCPNDHAKVDARSPIGKGYTKLELIKYKNDWEATVAERRRAFATPTLSRLIRFDGVDVNTVYLEVEGGQIRAFQDALTFELLGFNWGNVDVYPDTDKRKFVILPPLQELGSSKKVRLRFLNGTLANEVYVIWEDGKKHHVPDPETLREIGGFNDIELLGYEVFNSIPHGQPLLDIFAIRTKHILQQAMINDQN